MYDGPSAFRGLIQALLAYGLDRIAQVACDFLESEEGGGNQKRLGDARKPVGKVLRAYLEEGMTASDEELNEEIESQLHRVPRIVSSGTQKETESPELQLLRDCGSIDPTLERVQASSILQLLLGMAAAAKGLRDRLFGDQLELSEIAGRLRKSFEGWSPRWERQLHSMAFGAASKFPFWLESLTATQTYQTGELFCGGPLTVIFSRTSGLVVPLERLGADRFVQEFGCRTGVPDSLKNPEREAYFRRGTLNDKLTCERHYQWDKKATAEALYEGYLSITSSSARAAYLRMSEGLLVEALSKPYLQISQCDEFDWWKQRFTRNAGCQRQLLSNRGAQSKHISHAFCVDTTAITGLLASVLANVPFAATSAQPILIVLVATLGLTASELLRYRPAQIVKRYFDEVEKGQVEVVKPYRTALSPTQAQDAARRLVDELIALGQDLHQEGGEKGMPVG